MLGPQWYMLCVSFGLALDLLFVTLFRFVSVFCVVLGSTADTRGASVCGVFHILRDLVDYRSSGRFSTCSFSAFAWFNSEYKFLRQSTWLVFLVTTHLALFSFVVLRPLMLDIMAGVDQKDSFLRGFWWRFHRCSSWLRLSCPLCATTLAPVQLLTVEVPQVQLIIEVIYIPSWRRVWFPWSTLFNRP